MTGRFETIIPKQLRFPVLAWGLLAVGAAAGLYLQIHYHKFLNFDTLAYLDVAREYAHGRWNNAVNGCWSPLYSWIIAIFQKLGFSPLYGCYALNFASAAGCFFFLQKLSNRFIAIRLLRHLLQLFFLFLLLHSAMSTLTPDLLSAFLCLWFLNRVMHAMQQSRTSTMALVAPALLGAFMYWAKLYNFAVLQLFFMVALLLACWRRRQQVRRLATIWLLSLVFSSPWIILLSQREGRLVFSTTGKYVYNQVSPLYKGYYPIYDSLYAPPYAQARSFLVNPVHRLDQFSWSPFQSRAFFVHQLQLMRHSLNLLLRYTDRFRLGWLFVLGYLLFAWRAEPEIKRRLALPPSAGILWIFLGVYPLLYIPILMVDRYVYICTFLFSLLLFICAGKLWNFSRHKKMITALLCLFLAAGFFPLLKTLNSKILQNRGEYHYYRNFYLQLSKASVLRDKNFASDAGSALEAAQYAYYLNARYWATWHNESGATLSAQGIDYLLTESEITDATGFQPAGSVPLEGKTLYLYKTLEK